MKKWILLLGCSLLLCGCTQSNIVSRGGELTPDFETKTDVELHWDQGFEDLSSDIMENEQIVNLACRLEEVEATDESQYPTIYLIAFADSAMTPKEASVFATQMVKLLNDFMSDQDSSMASSASDSYGGLYDEYNVCVRVIPDDNQDDQSMALVDDFIDAGSAYRPIDAYR